MLVEPYFGTQNPVGEGCPRCLARGAWETLGSFVGHCNLGTAAGAWVACRSSLQTARISALRPWTNPGRTRFAGGPAEAWSTTGVADESLRGSGGAPSMKGHLHLARYPRCPSYKLTAMAAKFFRATYWNSSLKQALRAAISN